MKVPPFLFLFLCAGLKAQTTTLKTQFTDWDKAYSWPVNRLMTAEACCKEITDMEIALHSFKLSVSKV